MYVLSIDCGTQSLRALLFDKDGNCPAKVKIVYDEPYFCVRAGFCEQYAEYYYDTLCTAVRRMSKEFPSEFAQVKAICVTSQRDTMILIDEKNEPIRPAVLWLDQRKNKTTPRDVFTTFERLKYKLVRMEDASAQAMSVCKSYWFRENEPHNWERAKHVIFLNCYLTMKLTGVVADSVANQIGHLPFDSHIFAFPENSNHINYRQFGIPKEKLYPLVDPGDKIGCVTAESSKQTGLPAGLAVVAAGSDKGCETLGNGALSENVASISFGTTATVEITTKKYIEVLKYIPPYPSILKGYLNPEYEVYRGYWMVSWFKDEFAGNIVDAVREAGQTVENFLDKKLADIPPGADGLMLQPFWTPGITMKDARGAVIGFNDSHTLFHVYRAIIEGINYAMMEGLERIERSSKVKVDKVVISGGGSKSDEICRVTADMLGMQVLRAQTYETSGLGAAMVGFVHLGVYSDFFEAKEHMVRYTSSFMPNHENSKMYARLYKDVYKNMYPSLKKLYSKISSIIK